MIDNETLKQINIDSYKKTSKFNVITEYHGNLSDFDARLYDIDGVKVVCYVGTTGVRDILTDLALPFAKLPIHYKHGEQFLQDTIKLCSEIIITGHSLGGSIAQMLGGKYGITTICFSPFGTNLIQKTKQSNFITNYGMESDIVYMSNLENQVGKTYIIENPQNKYHFIKQGKINYPLVVNKSLRLDISYAGHTLEEYRSFSQACLLDWNLFNKCLIQHYCKQNGGHQK